MQRTGNKVFNSVFDMSTVGKQPAKVHLELKGIATPYQAPVHRVPQALCKPLKSVLAKHVDQGGLYKLRPDKQSDWVSMPVCLKKPNDSLQPCLDPRPLNKYLVHPFQKTNHLRMCCHILWELGILPLRHKIQILASGARERVPKSHNHGYMFGHYCW